MKKKILHICKYYYPVEGGIETVAKYLVDGLKDFDNTVVSFSTDGKSHKDIVDGIDVYRIAPAFKAFSQDVAFSYFFRLRKIIGKYRPDAIIIHCPNPFVYPIVFALAPKECKIALLWHADILAKGIVYKFIKPFETMALRRADMIIATSPLYIHPTSPIYKYRSKIDILPNGVIEQNLQLRNSDNERIEGIRKRFGDRPIILFVGRHIPYKGIDYLIESEKYIKSDCVILIAGRGPQTEYLKSLVHTDRIAFLGKISNDDLRCYYHAAEIFGFASINKAEAFGVALAEAMYCGCVPVTFHIEGSGVNWVSVKGETGEEVPLYDVRAYADAVDRILSDEPLRKRYAENARKRVLDKFVDNKVVAIANGLINKLFS